MTQVTRPGFNPDMDPIGIIFIVYVHTDPVYKITLSVSNLQKSLEYWSKLLGMNILQQSDVSAELAYSDNQVSMKWIYFIVFI